jgi:transcription termination factor Rho
MDITKLKRLPLSKLRLVAERHGVANAEDLDRKALLQALAAVSESPLFPSQAEHELPSEGGEGHAPSEQGGSLQVASEEGVLLQEVAESQASAPENGAPPSLSDAEVEARHEGEPSRRKRKRIRRLIAIETAAPAPAETPSLLREAREPVEEAPPGEVSELPSLSVEPVAPSQEPVQEEPPSKPAPRISVHELLEKLRISVQGVFVPVERQAHGYLRSALYNYHLSPDDVYVPASLIRQYNLRWGDTVEGKVRLPKEHERAYTLVEIERVNGLPPEYLRERRSIEHLTALFPTERFRLSEGTDDLTLRVIDLFAPIGKGQRGLIVAQPKTGKTIILQKVANAILRNHPEVYMMILLVDERPEEVTDFARNVPAEVVASTFDEEPARQIELAETVIEKAKRLAEAGLDVVVLMDSITRLARAYNHATPVSGRILTGGMDSAALHKPKRFFGAARKIEEGGSLTIVATALIDTGSKMDEVVFEEYKGTGNMELKLDRRLADRRIFPAINILESGTRHEEALLEPETLAKVWAIRKFLSELKPDEATEFLLERMRHTRTNQEFLEIMSKWSS